MRRVLFALVLLAAACGPQERTQPNAPEPETVSAPAYEPEALVGVWSFDRSCASGDGMRLNADDTASFDEWGQGTWSIDAQNRVVLALRRVEPGVEGDAGRPVTLTLSVGAPVTDNLSGEITSTENSAVRVINALRCPG